MGALDQGLMLASPAIAAGVAAPTSRPAAAPPPAPPAAASSSAPGALSQALTIMRAAKQANAQDPMTAAALQANDQDQAAREASAAKIDANMEQIKALQAQPDGARPAVPRLHDLAPAPVPEHKDPLRVFGQFLPVIAALGALTTRTPAINALNAATAMINAGKANDKLEEEKQRQAWIDNTHMAVENNTQLLNQYKLELDDHNATVTEKMAKVNAIAAQNRDYVTLAALRGGNLDSLAKFITLQTTATGQLATLTSQLQNQQLERDRLQNQELYQQAELEISRRRANNVSMGDSIGPILLKIQQVGQAGPDGKPKSLDQVLSPGEVQALKLYMDINRQAPYSNTPGEGGATGGGLGALTAGPAAAPAAPAAAPAVAGGAGGSVVVNPGQPAVDAGLLSARVAQAKAALKAPGVTRDQVKAVWVQQGLPPAEFDRLVK